MLSDGNWEKLKLIRTDFDEYGKAQGVEIRWIRTDRGLISFSYGFGIVLSEANPDGSDLFKSFKYVPDKYIFEYMTLLKEASMIVHMSMRNGKRDENGFLTAQSLEESVISNIRRKRMKPVVVDER